MFPHYEKEKDIEFFSDNYVVLSFDYTDETIEQMILLSNHDGIKDMAIIFEETNTKALSFSDDFFKNIGVNKESVDGFEINEEVAMVNKEHMDICYDKKDEKYISSQGVEYRVIGIFEESNLSKYDDTYAYLNLDSEKIKKVKSYSCLIYDTNSKKDSQNIVDFLKEKFKEAEVKIWDGTRFNSYVMRSIYVYVIFICGLILSFNCIGFTKNWVTSHRAELGVRRIVGGSKYRINIWLIKRYLLLTIISCLTGTILAAGIMKLLEIFEDFSSLRLLFGIRLHFVPVAFSWLLILLIGGCISEIYCLKLLKNNMLKNAREV